MRPSVSSRLLGGICATGLLLAVPALTQEQPESTLPDIFGQPAPAPAPAPPQSLPTPSGADDGAETPPAFETGLPETPDPDAPPGQDVRAPRLDDVAMPRDIDVLGPLTEARGGYGPRTFRGSNGRFLSALLGRLDFPLASRWAHIVLRRALLSEVPTPAGMRPADWIAERALTLVRMGEVDGAKLLIDAVPVDRFTPRLYAVAREVHLAAADVPALCPLAPTAAAISGSDNWQLAAGICAGIEGDDLTAATIFNRLRRQGNVANIDLLLAERVTSLASGIGRAANVAWEDTEELDTYRFGLATASQTEIPAALLDTMPLRMRGWAFRSSATPMPRRAAAAMDAAGVGIASSTELVEMTALQAAAGTASDEIPERVRLMRTAYTARSAEERIAALRALWTAGAAEGDAYAALIATGHAAARIAPADALAEDAPDLIRAMLAAGRINAALRWWPVLSRADESIRFAAWPMLALADGSDAIPADPSMVRASFREAAAMEGADEEAIRRRTGFLIAALRGLGRAQGSGWNGLAEDFGVGRERSRYTNRLGAVAARSRTGETAVLGAVGLQAPWIRVRPRDVEPIIAGFDAIGLAAEARMLAVESYMRG